MNRSLLLVTFVTAFASCSCGNAQKPGAAKLDAAAFSEKIAQTPGAIILDVRTPGEYAKEHIKDAVNFNWNDPGFKVQVAKMDKSEPVFVYCLSGGRSAAAAKNMREQGFTQVYEMEGGILKWKSADLPVETDLKMPAVPGMTLRQFEELIRSDKKVLVDFYAAWCAPCKKMKPYLDEIAKEMAGKVKVVRIDIDANPEIAKTLKIDALPLLHLYQNKEMIWSNTGYMDKEGIVKQLKK
ncbi:thioredoxin domain-containing protein [Niabella aquatica]